MKTAEFGDENPPDNENKSGTESDQAFKKNIDSMLDDQFAKEQDGEGEADGGEPPAEQNEEGEDD